MSRPVLGRLTPYERVFGEERFAATEFPAILTEARESGRELGDREQFAMLARTGILLRELMPADAEPGAIELYLELLFHAVHFWRIGTPVLALEESLVRFLVESDLELDDWSPRAASAAGYVELPPRLFWLAVDDELPPEPLEGFFLKPLPEASDSGSEAAADDHAELPAEVLMVLGMREDRPGFSVVPLTLDLSAAPDLGREAFRSELPGADDARLYSIRHPAAALALIRRTLWYVEEHESVIEVVEAAADDSTATRIAFKRVGLEGVS